MRAGGLAALALGAATSAAIVEMGRLTAQDQGGDDEAADGEAS
jgi:hypothetical protein